jgi:very-short-patch-repair endonuclease
MRHEPAPAEKKLWSCLRNRKLGNFKFRRQVPLGSFIADFYCLEAGLIVELDGASHSARAEQDVIRTTILERDDYRVMRFQNSDVFHHLDAVLKAILEACGSRSTPRAPSP